jgi:hypothetical protein
LPKYFRGIRFVNCIWTAVVICFTHGAKYKYKLEIQELVVTMIGFCYLLSQNCIFLV